ncbi:hypothetical protein J8F10_25695 [Gemmata sp. G18]|uniref:Uncharacterized protein n=1 Tax=Gemmata palustris TaxID=2822762 RepID=A0ABS5BZJ2_9BACT|nr:hypothetical protein [Gemmata palustris]MBP3958655.1 hypothetical protein [Gemmata palustris]
MRRIFALIVLVGLVTMTGCITPDDKRQWQEALKDLRGENTEMKTIAPISRKTE